MKVPISWLKELVEIPCGIDEISDSLSMSGFEVEEKLDLGSSINGVVIGMVQEIKPHPNSDKLNVCLVNIGKESLLQIVCGASNVRKGIHVLIATEGTYLKALDLKIKSSELRGVTSEGMICSYNELGIESDSDGIAILDDLNLELPDLGKSPKALLGLDEIVLDLAITANRPDGMSMVGIAREVSAIKKSSLSLPEVTISKDDYNLFNLKINTNNAFLDNGLYSIHKIDKLDGSLSSPEWMKNRLINSGLNAINLIVDITNYVMLEQGQPLHAFDGDLLNKLIGREVKEDDFGIRKATKGELMHCVDNKEYVLTEETNVVTCVDIPIAVAGVIGSLNSSVSKNTTNIWLEAALFSPTSVRISSRSIGKRTDSSSRFEKGISAGMTIFSAKRAIDLFKKFFNCEIKAQLVNKEISDYKQVVFLRRDKIHKVLGPLKVKKKQHENNLLANDEKKNSTTYENIRNISDSEIVDSLTLLGCKLEDKENGWDVTPPANRYLDLLREIDLIEEIARLIGYDSFDSNLPDPITPGGLNPKQSVERRIRQYFCAAGFQEITTFSLVQERPETIKIKNPLLSETSCLRTNLWEEHLKLTKRNIAAGKDNCSIFEIGKIYRQDNNKIIEKSILAGSLIGRNKIGKWNSNDKENNLDYFEARGYLETIFRGLNISIIDKKLINDPLLHPGKSAYLILEGKHFGKFGQLHPEVAQANGINENYYLFELDLSSILEATTRKNKWVVNFKEYPTVPAMERDISLLVDKSVTINDTINLIKKNGKPLIENVELIDRYEGDNISNDKIGLTYRIRYRNPKNTLVEKDIIPIHDRIISKLVKSISAEIR